MKVLLFSLLLANPPVAAWVFRDGRFASPEPQSQQATRVVEVPVSKVVQVPVEIVTNGSAPQWVYVKVEQSQAVPEPGVLPLVALAALLLMRRKRGN